jgi:predicted lipid-binding transport protein (Tim44 family)
MRRWLGAAAAASAFYGAGSALGRAGGGSHAGSGHASSSGGLHVGGSGGGGGGGLVAILLVALLVYFIYRRISRGGAAPLGAAPAAQAAVMSVLGAALGEAAGRLPIDASTGEPATAIPAIDRIREQDPGFELEVFLQRAEMTFFLVKRAIQQNDAEAVRPFVSDAVFTAVSGSIALTKTRHQHALLESLNVRAVHLEGAEFGPPMQRIQVHFDLVYRAKVLNDSNQVVSDEGEDHRHGERWTFSRQSSARTAVNGGVVAARCPQCGAELRLSLEGTCAHCRASITNGSVDWVVDEVQSAPFVGYSGYSSAAIAAGSAEQGIANLQAADPAFVLQAFLARVNTAFLALQDAWCRQNLDAGRAFLSPGAYYSWRAQLETMAAEGRRNVLENLAVARIEPVLIVHGRVFDDVTVRITASAADFEIDKDNRIVFGDRTVRPFTEDWTFQRSVGVTTTQKPGTLESTCPRCGAPLALTQIGECRYCKAAVTSGKFDWVVSRIEQDDMVSGDAAFTPNAGTAMALQVGGAIVGGLLSSLFSGDSSRDSGDWN